MGVVGAPIGLLGGSFDPIHNGHLQLACDALKHLPLDEIRFLPAAQPWQKGPMTAAEHRAKMVQLAIADEPRFALDMHEIERGGTTYTIDTLRALRALLPYTPLVLIMGSDQFARLDTWRDWQQIIETVRIAVAQRAGTPLKPSPNLQKVVNAGLASGRIAEFEMTPVDASATEVRHLLLGAQTAQAAQRLTAMVPAAVLDYIHTHHLYRN